MPTVGYLACSYPGVSLKRYFMRVSVDHVETLRWKIILKKGVDRV